MTKRKWTSFAIRAEENKIFKHLGQFKKQFFVLPKGRSEIDDPSLNFVATWLFGDQNRSLRVSVFLESMARFPLLSNQQWFKFPFQSFNHYLCANYRSSNSVDSSKTEHLLLTDFKSHATISGYFNVHNTEWLIYSYDIWAMGLEAEQFAVVS